MYVCMCAYTHDDNNYTTTTTTTNWKTDGVEFLTSSVGQLVLFGLLPLFLRKEEEEEEKEKEEEEEIGGRKCFYSESTHINWMWRWSLARVVCP